MDRKKTALLAMLFVAAVLAIGCFVRNYEPKYAENEISEDLCIEIVQREMKEVLPVQIAGIHKVDDSIIAGYAVGTENQMKTFGFLQFVLAENADKYNLYHNHNDILETSFLNISVGEFSTNFAGDVLKPYYIFLSDNTNLKEIDLLEKTSGEYQVQHKLAVEDGLFMYIWAAPEAGEYIFWSENNQKWFNRRFVSDTQLFTDDSGNELNIRFDVDYSDIIPGGQANINCRATLIGASNPENYYISNVILRQAARPCTVWFYTEISGMADFWWPNSKLLADLDVYTNSLLSDNELEQDYNKYGEKKQDYFYMGYKSNNNYVRNLQITMAEKCCLNQPGHFFNVFSQFGDYFNTPDEENELLSGNDLQIEWLIDVRSKPANETARYTFRQSVPVVIR